MSRPFAALILGNLLLLAGACIPPGDTSIRGFVQGAVWDSGGPLVGALAWVDETHFGFTDDQGEFRIEGVEGPLDLHLAADGYRTRTILEWNDTLAQFYLQPHAVASTYGSLEGVVRLPFVPEEEVSVHVHGGGGRSTVVFAPGEQESSFSHTANTGLTAGTAYTRGGLMMEFYGHQAGQLVSADVATVVEVELAPASRAPATGTVPALPGWADGGFTVSATLSLGGDGVAYVSSGSVPEEDGNWTLEAVSLPPATDYTFSASASSSLGDQLSLYHPEVQDLGLPVDFPDAALVYPEVELDLQRHVYSWERVPQATYMRLRLQQRTLEGNWATVWTAEGTGVDFEMPRVPVGGEGLTQWQPLAETRARIELYAVPGFDPVLNWSFDALESRLRTRWYVDEPVETLATRSVGSLGSPFGLEP